MKYDRFLQKDDRLRTYQLQHCAVYRGNILVLTELALASLVSLSPETLHLIDNCHKDSEAFLLP